MRTKEERMNWTTALLCLILVNMLAIWIMPSETICEPCLYTKEGAQDGFSVKYAVSKNYANQIGLLQAPPKMVCVDEISTNEAKLIMSLLILIAVSTPIIWKKL